MGRAAAPRDLRDVVDVGEGARLRAVAEDGERGSSAQLRQEDPKHVAIAVSGVLQRAVHVVRPEDNPLEPKLPTGGREVELHRQLPYAVRILGRQGRTLRQRQLAGAVHSNRRGEHEAPHTEFDRRVDQQCGRDQVGAIIVRADEVRQTFGGVRREVVHVFEARRRRAVAEEAVNERRIPQVATHKRGTRG